MSLRFCQIFFGLLLLSANLTVAQQVSKNQDKPLMSLVPGLNGPDLRDIHVLRLSLRTFEAAMGDLSLCGNDVHCLNEAKRIKSWRCASDLCDGAVKSKEPITCAPELSQKLSIQAQEQINALICPLIKSPTVETRKAALNYMPGNSEDDLVKMGGYLLALKGSAGACEEYIKGYVGSYSYKWNAQWYSALSGCRILARERTRQEEERDFYSWFGVLQGAGNCSSIINSQMREICNNPAAASPVPGYGH